MLRLHIYIAVSCGFRLKLTVLFIAGEHTYILYFMSDSYMGCDQECEIKINVLEDADSGGDDSDDVSD